MKKIGTLTVRFDSDWHIGTGAGIPHSVDRTVVRDEDGLPYIPAKTLTGILRDGAEKVAMHLGGEGHLKNLFGGRVSEEKSSSPPTPARLSIRPARYPQRIRRAAREKGLNEAFCFVKPGVAIDGQTDRAKEDHLFFYEMARKGSVLVADLFLSQGDLSGDEKAFVEKACKAVKGIGGKRRCGSGACRVSVTWTEDPPESAVTGAEPQTGAAGWKRLPLVLSTILPVVIKKRRLGNVVESRDYIPGTSLLPWVCARLNTLEGTPQGFPGSQVRHGRIIVTNFTPLVDGGASLPAPFCFSKPKDSEENPSTFRNAILQKPGSGEIHKPIKGGWVSMEGERAVHAHGNLFLTSRTHNTVDDDLQRPTESVGGVFTYEAIRPGLEFSGEVLIAPEIAETLPAGWWKKLQGMTTIGLSKKDEYGLVRLKRDERPLNPSTHRKGRPLPGPDGRQYLVVYLASDLILRDETLCPSTDAETLRRELESALDLELLPVEDEPQNPLGGTASVVSRPFRVDSWHTRWNLPRPSLRGLSAGSCALFETHGFTEDHVRRLEEAEITGIGERRAEGFGRVLFNPPLLTGSVKSLEHPESPTLTQSPLTDAVDATVPTEEQDRFLELVEQTKWKTRIHLLAAEKAVKENPLANRGGDQELTKSQFGALRTAALTLRSAAPAGRRPFIRWLGYDLDSSGNLDEHDRWPKERKDKWGKRRRFLLELAGGQNGEDLGKIWDILGLDPDMELRDGLWAMAVRTFLVECARAATKKGGGH
jgi:CRISPR-associated protein Csx10